MRCARIIVGLFLSVGLSALHAEPVETVHGDWTQICEQIEGKTICQMAQSLDIENESGRNRLLETVVRRVDGDQLILQMLLPFGLDLRPGIVMQIDEGEEISAPFLTCIESGCLVVYPLGDSDIANLRAGKLLRVGFRPVNTEQTLVVELSLNGFTAASQKI